MLTHIFVKDLAIVSSLELDFAEGMTALTGETGAGKSILIDALGLALGDKADPDIVRPGCERAEVAAGFDLADFPEVRDWLIGEGLDDSGECLVRRLLVKEGRSRAYINGRPVAASQLQGLGERLVDIHGQHAHQSLLRPAAQRVLLDGYGGHAAPVAEVAALFRRLRSLEERMGRLTAQGADREAQLDLLRYQVNELETLGLSAEEIADLDREQKRLANVGQLQSTAARLLDALYDGEPSVHGELGRAVADLDVLAGFDERLSGIRELVASAVIQIEESASGLRQYLDDVDLDPALINQVEDRLAQVHDLARKYRIFPEQIPETLARLSLELEGLERDDIALGDLEQECNKARWAFLEAAERLSEQRTTAAKGLSETVSKSMQDLGMSGGHFAVRILREEPEAGGAHGLDRVEFLVSVNPGQPLQPLAKVASGGELSRISLAIQVATAECGSVPTLVFDEVDVGIGGRVAEIVGAMLRSLGRRRQVLCVTHLPQVAAQAHNHLQVRKYAQEEQTYAAIALLDAEARVEEIARMLGGREITRKTLEHAREMIRLAPESARG